MRCNRKSKIIKVHLPGQSSLNHCEDNNKGKGDEEKRQNLKFIFQLENYGGSEESGEKLNFSCSFLKRVRMTETALQIQLV